MMIALGFIIGALGCAFGVMISALLIAAGQADDD